MSPAGVTLVVRGARVVTPAHVAPAAVHVAGGRIAAVTAVDAPVPAGARIVEAGERVVMPAIVDTHVHVNEPGRTEWEGFATATSAAAAGGVGTLVDMPLNSTPVTTTAAALDEKRRAATGQCRIDVAFWGGLVPQNRDALDGLLEAGARGVKAFLCDSGIPDFPPCGEPELRAAMPILARRGAPLLAHAEIAVPAAEPVGPPTQHATWLASRPARWEVDAIELLIRLCRDTGCRVHVVHLSAASALPALEAARSEGLPVSVETCPHYLCFEAEAIGDGRTEFKCAPPIREAANRDALWDALRRGVIDMVVSDHSPCTPALKAPESGSFVDAWGGISSLQLGLAAVWTEAQRRGFAPADVARWMCAETARFAGLGERKGSLEAGKDADLVVWDPDAAFTVEPERLAHRHALTPYAGRELRGRVELTLVRGAVVYEDGRVCDPPRGDLL